MRIKSLWLRRIHKWVGLAIGLQFVLWTISGAAMALLNMEAVAGGAMVEAPISPPPGESAAWQEIQAALSGRPVTALKLRPLLGRPTIEVTSAGATLLFDAGDGRPIAIDRTTARTIALAAHPGQAAVVRVTELRSLDLAVREHMLPIWQVDFADAGNSSYYISGANGAVLERRNDTWRWWDMFWMLHNMDYASRTSFNHPLIIVVGFAMTWLAATGFWLLFRTMWRHDFAWTRRNR